MQILLCQRVDAEDSRHSAVAFIDSLSRTPAAYAKFEQVVRAHMPCNDTEDVRTHHIHRQHVHLPRFAGATPIRRFICEDDTSLQHVFDTCPYKCIRDQRDRLIYYRGSGRVSFFFTIFSLKMKAVYIPVSCSRHRLRKPPLAKPFAS